MQPLSGARYIFVLHHREELCQVERIGRQQVEQIVQTLRTRRLGVSKSLRQKPRVAVVERPELHRVALPAPCSNVSGRDNGVSDRRRKVLANQIEIRGVVEDVENPRSSELLVNACDELRDFVARGNLQEFCDLQEGGGEALPRVRRDPEGVVVGALALEAIEHLYRQLSLSDAARADDCLDDDRLGARRERVEQFAEFLPPPGEVGNDVRRGQRMYLLWPRTGGSLLSMCIAAGRGTSVPAAPKPEVAQKDESLDAASPIAEDMDATTQSALWQAHQASRRLFWVAEPLAVEWNRRGPEERSRMVQNPPRKGLSFSKDLHEAVSLDLELAYLPVVSLGRGLELKKGRGGENLRVYVCRSRGERQFCSTDRRSSRAIRGPVRGRRAALHTRFDSRSPFTLESFGENARRGLPAAANARDERGKRVDDAHRIPHLLSTLLRHESSAKRKPPSKLDRRR